ncbi:MAG TPA: ribonuclease III [Rhizomicrobium sp.]|nr:ribonuclease III [Rhizomicrobium sp.]
MTDLETALGYSFQDRDLLTRALTHASVSEKQSNERLEFFGDRVLGLVIAEKIFALFPDDDEGALALKYNALVRGETCAKAGEKAGLGPHLILAGSESGSGGRQKAAILSGATEAVIAAIYLDGGYEAARAFVEKFWADAFASLGADMRDAKTVLQEWAQGRKANPCAPAYRLAKREGPDHAPSFDVEVSVSGEEPATGAGRSKREAEQAAAKAMLTRLGLMAQ